MGAVFITCIQSVNKMLTASLTFGEIQLKKNIECVQLYKNEHGESDTIKQRVLLYSI